MLGLNDGTVSKIVREPKPWSPYTQAGARLIIRMNFYLEKGQVNVAKLLKMEQERDSMDKMSYNTGPPFFIVKPKTQRVTKFSPCFISSLHLY